MIYYFRMSEKTRSILLKIFHRGVGEFFQTHNINFNRPLIENIPKDKRKIPSFSIAIPANNQTYFFER